MGVGGQQCQTESRAISGHGLDSGHIPGIDGTLNAVGYLGQTTIMSETGLTCLVWLWFGTEHECTHTFRRRNIAHIAC